MALPKREVTADGFERQFATNVLGPFLLTGLLLPAILRATAPRIVTVSSEAHTRGGPVPVEDLNSDRDYRPLRAYAETKLENILVTRELQRRAGERLLAVACHPGVRVLFWAARPIIQQAAEGVAVHPARGNSSGYEAGRLLRTGAFVQNTWFSSRDRDLSFARDKDAAKRLFEDLERIAGIRYPL